MRTAELPWQADPTRRFARLADRPWAVLLDSCRDRGARGRYDICAADPWLTLECRGREALITRRGEREIVRGDPFKLLRNLLKPLNIGNTDLPFSGGAIGYFAYELGRGCVDLGAPARSFPGYPEMAVGLYDWAVVSDHRERRCRLVAQERDPQTARRWDGLLELLSADAPAPAAPDYRVLAPPRSNFTRAGYGRAFRAVRDYLRAGDCYQVNLAQRWAAPSEGRLWTAYLRSRRDNPAPFSGYFRHPRAEIASASPERFLRARDGRVETRPIKGTLRREPGGGRGRPGAARRQRQGPRREPDDRRPAAQRPGQELRARHGAGAGAVPGRELRHRAPPGEHRDRAAARGPRRAGPVGGLLSGRLHHRRAEAPGDADHRGAGAGPARGVLRQPGLPGPRRRHGTAASPSAPWCRRTARPACTRAAGWCTTRRRAPNTPNAPTRRARCWRCWRRSAPSEVVVRVSLNFWWPR